jgi:hypothetical protein
VPLFFWFDLFRGYGRTPGEDFAGFLGDLKTPKGHFEINWPLETKLMNFFKIQVFYESHKYSMKSSSCFDVLQKWTSEQQCKFRQFFFWLSQKIQTLIFYKNILIMNPFIFFFFQKFFRAEKFARSQPAADSFRHVHVSSEQF